MGSGVLISLNYRIITNIKKYKTMFKLSQIKPFIIQAVSSCFSSHPKKLYWFEVRYCYTKNGVKKFDYIAQIGVEKFRDTLNRRMLKKIDVPLNKKEGVKKLLDNGKFDVEIICYLGRFSK